MKKAFCLLISLFLLVGCTALGEGAAILNPNGYDLLQVTDIYTNDDSEYVENGNQTPSAASLTIQGSFGSITFPSGEVTGAYEYERLDQAGFDPEETVCLTLAEGCEIWMPADPLYPTENVKVDDLQAWYDAANVLLAEYLAEGESSLSFYAAFEMNDDGELTKIEYCYYD